MPLATKLSVANPTSLDPQRGWSGVGVETTAKLAGNEKNGNLSDAKVFKIYLLVIPKLIFAKEHYDFGPSNDASFPNRWPKEEDLPGFHPFIELYSEMCQQLSLDLMKAVEIGLKLPPGSIIERCHPNCSELRLNYYPAIGMRKLNEGDTKRIWPHTDFGVITLLLRDEVGGLEFEDRTQPGTFVPVPRRSPDEMIVNVCDTLERWTNSVLRAGLHQVSAPKELKDSSEAVVPERFSVAFLMKANREALVGSLPEFVGEEPSKYDDITALEYQRRKNHVVYYG